MHMSIPPVATIPSGDIIPPVLSTLWKQHSRERRGKLEQREVLKRKIIEKGYCNIEEDFNTYKPTPQNTDKKDNFHASSICIIN